MTHTPTADAWGMASLFLPAILIAIRHWVRILFKGLVVTWSLVGLTPGVQAQPIVTVFSPTASHEEGAGQSDLGSESVVAEFELVPGMFVAQGEPIPGGCRLPHTRVTVDPSRMDPGTGGTGLYMDENCTLRGAFYVLPGDSISRESEQATKRSSQHEEAADVGEGGEGAGLLYCNRYIRSRVTLYLTTPLPYTLSAIVPNYALTRVGQSIHCDDDGVVLFCTGFERYVTSSSFWGFVTAQQLYNWNTTGNPAQTHIEFGDPAPPAPGQVFQEVIGEFYFGGSLTVPNLNPGFQHAFNTYGHMRPGGLELMVYDNVGDFPNQWVTLNIPVLGAIDYRFFTVFTYDWRIDELNCPPEWVTTDVNPRYYP